jgi:hypothetical protein
MVEDLQKLRKLEMSNYSRELFWQQPARGELIKKLLKKIYDLEDRLELIEKINKK